MYIIFNAWILNALFRNKAPSQGFRVYKDTRLSSWILPSHRRSPLNPITLYFLFHGKGFDLKTLGKTTGKNPIFNRIKNARGQSKNFILDVTNSGLEGDFIQKQLEKVFVDKGTEFVDEVVVIRNGKIEKLCRKTPQKLIFVY